MAASLKRREANRKAAKVYRDKQRKEKQQLRALGFKPPEAYKLPAHSREDVADFLASDSDHGPIRDPHRRPKLESGWRLTPGEPDIHRQPFYERRHWYTTTSDKEPNENQIVIAVIDSIMHPSPDVQIAARKAIAKWSWNYDWAGPRITELTLTLQKKAADLRELKNIIDDVSVVHRALMDEFKSHSAM